MVYLNNDNRDLGIIDEVRFFNSVITNRHGSTGERRRQAAPSSKRNHVDRHSRIAQGCKTGP